MEKTRTLPPLVRGKVTGVLDFFVDEIRLKNTLTDNSDVVLKVQWWGEDLPAYIRPKRTHPLFDINSAISEVHFHSTKYQIKTTLNLFELYLKSCEVLELSVLDAVECDVLGSAFLRDLVSILSNKSDITVPVVDYLGKEIGDVVIRICFLYKPVQHEQKDKQTFKTNKLRNSMHDQSFNILSAGDSYLTQSNNYFTDNNKKINFGDSLKSFQLFKGEIDYVNQIPEKMSSKTPLNINKTSRNSENILKSRTFSLKSLPEVTTSSDSSKVLCFGAIPLKSIKKTENDLKTRVISKYNSNSIKCKSKNVKNLASFPYGDSKEFKTKSANQIINKNPSKTTTGIKKGSSFKTPAVDKSVRVHQNCNQTIENCSSKDSVKSKVFDYLLGSELNKEDEEKAVKEFIRLSPSENLVTSINQLCLTSDNDSFNSRDKYHTNTPESVKPGCLTFNFDDPIERNYYEKFFLKQKSTSDFELAELLNQPENRNALEKLKGSDKRRGDFHSSSSRNFKNELPKSSESLWTKRSPQSSSKYSLIERETLEPKENYLGQCNQTDSNAKGCARCKYYKKLDELDIIIESLKHFEEKMLSHNTAMESSLTRNSDMFIRKYHPKNSSESVWNINPKWSI